MTKRERAHIELQAMAGGRNLRYRYKHMKTRFSLKRRDFLRVASAAGALGVLSTWGGQPTPGGAATDDRTGSASLDKVMPRLDALAREYLTIPKEEGQFLNLLIKLMRAKRVLELGTGYGYTTIWLALALTETGGQLTTVEIMPERAELARKHVAEVGLTSRVAFHQRDAHAIVPTLAGAFDLAYFDADKGGNADYFNKLFPMKLPPGSLLVAHNAILLADKMKSYLELIRKHPAFDTLIVRATEDDGLALSYRKRPGA
jgi:caffeoyl-CoA O-methyltransferase